MFDFVSHGLLEKSSFEVLQSRYELCSGEVTDVKGNKIRVLKMSFGKDGSLPGKIGEAEARIFAHKVKEINFKEEESSFRAEITTTDGQTERGKVGNAITLSGEVAWGEFAIELKNVESILYENHET